MKKIILFVTALFLCGLIHAQDYHYTYDFHDYEHNFPLTGEVYLNGEVLASSSIEIAAFVGDQVRGSEYLLETDPVNYPGHFFLWLGISYDNTGETVTLKMYDHATGIEYTDCATTLVIDGQDHGEMWDPFNVYFTAEEPIPYGPDYPWVVTGGYENFMYLEAQIQINGVPVTNTNWEVGAFCGDECRGLGDAESWWPSPVDGSLICEIVVGGATGDVINFYLYDLTNSEVFHGVCNLAQDWVDDDLGDIYEPYVINFLTEQTFTKEIAAYTEDGGYYLIASPIGNVAPTAVENMISNNYDLYYFDQNQELEWINYEGGNGGFDLVSGKGYLYANSENVTLAFTGYMYDGDGEVELVKNVDNNATTSLEGWNLVGNPFAETAYIGEKAFYRMNQDGSEVEAAVETAIAPMEGIFVIADIDEEVLTFSTEEPESKGAALVMNITRDRGNSVDRAIVRFNEGGTLPKFMLNEKNTKLYIPQDNKDYAVVNATNEGEMPVNFKAAKNGTYTFVVSAQDVDFRYLHLIDNLTGIDVDLLVTPSYSFQARTTDFDSRFKLVVVTGQDDDNFVFFSNGLWIINNDGDAVLQVVDVTGRIMSSEEIHGCCSKHVQAAPGVYMLRLVKGDDVKVQKIVVD